jgi:hypothetical protein
MMKRKKWIAIVLFVAALAVLGIWGRKQLRIDSCLDQGGRWNYDQATCEMK